jgi:hypothetical protein
MGNATIKYQKQAIFLRNIQNTFCLTYQKTDERPRTAAEKIIAEKKREKYWIFPQDLL